MIVLFELAFSINWNKEQQNIKIKPNEHDFELNPFLIFLEDISVFF